MRYTAIFSGLTSLCILTSCGSSSGKDDKLVMDTTIQSPAGTTNIQTVTSDTTKPISISPSTPVVTSPVPGGGALNPAHGQPGHRCDIAVGAPLNSTPSATTPAATPIQLNTNNTPSSPAISPVTVTKNSTPVPNTATGMNPAHGQPGHRCDIAVGAPLSSPPGNTTAPASQPLSLQPSIPGATPVVTPVKPAANPVATQAVTAPGMNPAHGQPGHRCDIAVGAPLNSKPTIETEKQKLN